MSFKVETEEKHTETVTAFLSHTELERVIGKAVADKAGITDFCLARNRGYAREGVHLLKITFEDAMEGSPGYKIGTQARVEFTKTFPTTNDVAGDGFD